MAITIRAQRQQRRNEALQLISSGVPPTDAASQLTVKWGCSRRTSLRDIEIAQSELANALDSVELQQMVGWMATQYQRLAAKAERDGGRPVRLSRWCSECVESNGCATATGCAVCCALQRPFHTPGAPQVATVNNVITGSNVHTRYQR